LAYLNFIRNVFSVSFLLFFCKNDFSSFVILVLHESDGMERAELKSNSIERTEKASEFFQILFGFKKKDCIGFKTIQKSYFE
jgi:hypothetical protein